MSGNVHLKQSIRGLRFKLILLCLALFAFLILFSVLGTSVKVNQNMLQDLDQMPKFAQKMMGEGFAQSVIKYGIITVGYLHPAALVIFILFILMAVSQMITSEITTGTIGFTLSKPISRKRIYLNLGIIIYAGTAIIALFAFLASYLGIILFHKNKFSSAPFANISWNLFLLMIFVAGYIALFAAFSENSKKMYTYSGISLFLLYLLSFAVPLWQPLKYIAPISPFTYYKPMAILMGNRIDMTTSISLIAVSLIMFIIATLKFSKQDIASG